MCQFIQFFPANNNILEVKQRRDFVVKATNSQFHDQYSDLDYSITSFLTAGMSSRATSLIIKARDGILDLKSRSFRSNSDAICPICKMNEIENTIHFIGTCPIYNEFRTMYFGKNNLNESDVISLLTNYYIIQLLFK